MSLVTRHCLIVAAALLLVIDTFAQKPSPKPQSSPALSLPARFTGTWKRDDGDETVTLSVNSDAVDGDAVVVSNSNGTVGTGILKGEKILYTGAIEAAGGERAKVAGAYMVSPDASSLVKLRKIILTNGTRDETITYLRTTPIVFNVPTTPPPLLTRPENESSAQDASAKPATASVRSEPFVGTWHPADDSAKVTIAVNGKNVSLKYSPGPREAGTIRGGKIECESISSGDGTNNTDLFEMSPNGRTLIRRRTITTPRGETGHETLTYNRTE